jgi:hypothetical protein
LEEIFMDKPPLWMWDEMRQVGTDYGDVGEVARYEKRMGQFRDLGKEDAGILGAARVEYVGVAG